MGEKIFGISISIGILVLVIFIIRASKKDMDKLESVVMSLKAENVAQILLRKATVFVVRILDIIIYPSKWVMYVYVAILGISLATAIPLGAQLYQTGQNVGTGMKDFLNGFLSNPAEINQWDWNFGKVIAPTRNPIDTTVGIIGEGVLDENPDTEGMDIVPTQRSEEQPQIEDVIPTAIPDYSEFWSLAQIAPFTSTYPFYKAPNATATIILVEKNNDRVVWKFVNGGENVEGYEFATSIDLTLELLDIKRVNQIKVGTTIRLPFK